MTAWSTQSPHRVNTTVHVCWYRNTSVSRADHSAAVEVAPPPRTALPKPPTCTVAPPGLCTDFPRVTSSQPSYLLPACSLLAPLLAQQPHDKCPSPTRGLECYQLASEGAGHVRQPAPPCPILCSPGITAVRGQLMVFSTRPTLTLTANRTSSRDTCYASSRTAAAGRSSGSSSPTSVCSSTKATRCGPAPPVHPILPTWSTRGCGDTLINRDLGPTTCTGILGGGLEWWTPEPEFCVASRTPAPWPASHCWATV